MTEKEIKVKHWLNRAFYADKKIKALDMLLRANRMHAEGLSGVKQYNYTAKSETRLNGTENAFLKLAETECIFNEQKQELNKIFDEIYKAVSSLHDDELEAVLIHRYLLFHTIEQTAEIMHYSAETVRRKTNKAISKLCEKLLVCGTDIW